MTQESVRIIRCTKGIDVGEVGRSLTCCPADGWTEPDRKYSDYTTQGLDK